GDADAGNSGRAVDREPKLDGRVLVRLAPARGDDIAEPLAECLRRVDPPIAVLAGHLDDEPIARLARRLGPDRVMGREKGGPVSVAAGPLRDAVEIGGPEAELVGPPAEQVDVLGGAKVEDVTIKLGNAKDDDRLRRLLDVAAKLGADLFRGDLLETGV